MISPQILWVRNLEATYLGGSRFLMRWAPLQAWLGLVATPWRWVELVLAVGGNPEFLVTCPHNMAAAFLQHELWRKRERGGNHDAFYSLIVIRHHFYSVLLGDCGMNRAQVSLILCGREPHKGMQTRKQGSPGASSETDTAEINKGFVFWLTHVLMTASVFVYTEYTY